MHQCRVAGFFAVPVAEFFQIGDEGGIVRLGHFESTEYTAIGGAVVSGPGIAWIGFAGGAIAVVGVILAITVLFPAIRRAKPVA